MHRHWEKKSANFRLLAVYLVFCPHVVYGSMWILNWQDFFDFLRNIFFVEQISCLVAMCLQPARYLSPCLIA